MNRDSCNGGIIGGVWAEPGKLHVLGSSANARPLHTSLAAQLQQAVPTTGVRAPTPDLADSTPR